MSCVQIVRKIVFHYFYVSVSFSQGSNIIYISLRALYVRKALRFRSIYLSKVMVDSLIAPCLTVRTDDSIPLTLLR